MKLKKALRRYIILTLVAWGFVALVSSCSKGLTSNAPSSNWPVYYEIDLNSSKAKPLLPSGGYIVVTEPELAHSALGFGGLLIIHAPLPDSFGNEYYAYDLACPVEMDPIVKLFVNDKLEAECPSCHSAFAILYGGGNPTHGKAEKALTTYKVFRSGSRLVITNR